jgi:hypothetical protein
LDLLSNASDESTMTLGGPPTIREKKIDRYDESLDRKLQRYLQKWIIVTIFYQVQWIFAFFEWLIPATKAFKLFLAFWVMMPQCKGEFYLYHLLEDQIIMAEKKILEYRSVFTSSLTVFFGSMFTGCLKLCIAYVTQNCIGQI